MVARRVALLASVLAIPVLSARLRADDAPLPGPARPVRPAIPSASEAALGDLAGLPAPLRRALTERGDAFPALPRPAGLDWLNVHQEPGQTFGQFVEGPRRTPTEERRTIRLVALDALGEGGVPTAERLAAYLGIYYGLPARVHALAEPLPTFESRTHPATRRVQILTTDVLRWLRRELPSDAFGLVALTRRDLYPDPEWNFVFGQAAPPFGVGVFSFARYDPSFPGSDAGAPADEAGRRRLVLRRSLKVLAHEVGHLLGLEHCVHFHCLMNGSNHLAEMDAAPPHLCPVCLRKAQHAAGFDVVARYAALAGFYRAEGLDDDAAWAAARAAHARGE